MSQSLDRALGNGIPLGRIVELCGLPGSGRTELCIQLCVCVQIPSELGGLEAEAVYIDTSSNFRTSRLLEIAEGCRNYVFENIDSLHESSWNTKVLKGIHYMETFGVSEFCASIILLEELLQTNDKIKLIVIDNIAFPFKADCLETDRTGILCRTITTLRKIAIQKNIAVILTNEMTTRIGIGVVGALGGVWAHCSGIRLFMAPPHVAVTHNTGKPDSVAEIKITKDGIRDCG
ncbi:DNA repair protein RAD51 homolog 3-like [Arctopsyche grandis]|uniref:DNA repair protein RAD51 homolog 3-like n=1 Tax=Arctopsyche grandis TaxID=121162 RepID=UPI00406DA03D